MVLHSTVQISEERILDGSIMTSQKRKEEEKKYLIQAGLILGLSEIKMLKKMDVYFRFPASFQVNQMRSRF